jgi:uncharacterized protein with PQ loop repeat
VHAIMTTSQVLGAVATGVVGAGYVPQIAHLVRQRCTAGMSVPAFSLWCLASLLFLVHAAIIEDGVVHHDGSRRFRQYRKECVVDGFR